jgi:hypothetical protein
METTHFDRIATMFAQTTTRRHALHLFGVAKGGWRDERHPPFRFAPSC